VNILIQLGELAGFVVTNGQPVLVIVDHGLRFGDVPVCTAFPAEMVETEEPVEEGADGEPV
jgi:hypothetical protein